MDKHLIFSVWFFLILVSTGCGKHQDMGGRSLPPVKEVDLNSVDPELFTEEEWYMPYYLAHFATVANSVSDTGLNHGFFDVSVWRGSKNHHPYNARVMEGILSLVWFYTSQRPWNPYYDDTALKLRIEAALNFWCNIQQNEGRFSEYAPERWSLAPTAFATKFIGRALWLLDAGPKINHKVFERSRLALRKAIYIGFTDEKFWEHGRNYTNQYANLWGGALLYLDKWPDAELENLLQKRFQQSMEEFQSPAGFFYEKGGPDWGYNLSTHHSDLQVAWEFSGGKNFQKGIIEKTQNWYDWFTYNAVKEPGNACYYLNRAIETRQRKGFYLKNEAEDPAHARWVPQAKFIPVVHAFEPSDGELKQYRKQKYEAMRISYPEVAPLEVGEFNAFSPYAFLHEGMSMWFPSDQEKEEAISLLPYLKNENFIHIRNDNRSETIYTYVRKPAYYAIFNAGKKLTQQQRYGLGLVWNPSMGTIIQSQSGSDVADYGTRTKGYEKTFEAGDIIPRISLEGQTWEPANAKNDLRGEDFEVSYELGALGRKVISFENERLMVRIEHKGSFVETIPILKSSEDRLKWDKNQIMLQNDNGTMIISFVNSSGIEALKVEAELNNKDCYGFKISADSRLEYEIGFADSTPGL